ncbi:MAG: hypothetical protein HDR31_00995 [Mycoplasma sp.]|nr:hypothetical protein [Mycoplasma sp.]
MKNSSVSPEINDLYNDYSYNQGFVNIENNLIVNFYDWFGLKLWSFDVGANSVLLFNSISPIGSLKVKSYVTNSQIFVYGTLADSYSTSFVFRLNIADGLLVPFGSLKAFVSSGSDISSTGLIQNINLLTISNDSVILTPKTPVASNDGTNYTLNFSVLTINDGSIVIKQCDISSITSSNVDAVGEIIFAQKVNNNYSFGVKAESIRNGNQFKASIVAFLIKDVVYSNPSPFSLMNWLNTHVDLDKAIFCIQDISTSATEQKLIATMKYDTSSITYTPNVHQTYIALATLNSSSFTVQAKAYATVKENGATSANNIAGIMGFLFNYDTKTPYVIVANNTSTSTFAIAPLNFSGSSTAEGWIDLNNVIQTSENQIMNIGFIPNSNKDNNYYGYLQVEKQDDSSVDQISSETRTLFKLDSLGTSLSVSDDINFSFGISDDQINQKYNNKNYSANEETKATLLADLVKVKQNDSTYPVQIDSNDLIVDTKNNTIKGQVTLALDNWWNSDKSKVTRYVNLDFGSDKENNISTFIASDKNAMVYSVVVVAILVLIAVGLIVYKIMQNKRKNTDN